MEQYAVGYWDLATILNYDGRSFTIFDEQEEINKLFTENEEIRRIVPKIKNINFLRICGGKYVICADNTTGIGWDEFKWHIYCPIEKTIIMTIGQAEYHTDGYTKDNFLVVGGVCYDIATFNTIKVPEGYVMDYFDGEKYLMYTYEIENKSNFIDLETGDYYLKNAILHFDGFMFSFKTFNGSPVDNLPKFSVGRQISRDHIEIVDNYILLSDEATAFCSFDSLNYTIKLVAIIKTTKIFQIKCK